MNVKGVKHTALVDPEAKARLQRAAEAAGLETIEDLANLVVDSGALALPPTDGATESYTLEELGVQMRSQMPTAASERPSWFADLVDTQQAAVVTLLRERGYSSTVVARDFGLQPLDVTRIYTKHVDDLGAQVVNVRLNTLVGHLQLASERATEGSMVKKDWATYWRIQKEMIVILQSLGIVKQAIKKVEVAVKFDDQTKAEVDLMVDLEEKKRARLDEMKVVDAVVTDAIPDRALPLPAGPSMEEPYEDSE